MTKTALLPLGGGSAGGASGERPRPQNNLSHRSTQAGHHNHISPLTWSGNLADTLMDRIAMHVRKHAPARFGCMTLDQSDLIFSESRGEVRRLVFSHCE